MNPESELSQKLTDFDNNNTGEIDKLSQGFGKWLNLGLDNLSGWVELREQKQLKPYIEYFQNLLE